MGGSFTGRSGKVSGRGVVRWMFASPSLTLCGEGGMKNILVKRYANPEAVGGWAGWIEPEDRSWIVYLDVEGKPLVFLDRDPNNGAARGPAAVTPA